jgi:carbon monoxide dehydrogenase subunit G
VSVRVRLERRVDVAAPASQVWDYVTDWPRQGEWIPQTRVENLDSADHVGGRFRAWSGIGRPPSSGGTRGVSPRGVGFWDPMTITAWERTPDGGGRCEVLHLGAVVKGEGEFVVEARGEAASRFVWAEMVVLPFGRLGAVGWRVARPVVERLIDRGLRAMRDRVEDRSGA